MVCILAVLLWQTVIIPGNEQRFQQRLLEITLAQQAEIGNFQKRFQSRMLKFTERPETILLASQRNREGLVALASSIRLSVPDVKRTAFYFPEEAQQQKDSGGAVGYVQLTMMNRLQRGEQVFPEVSRGQDPEQWQIHWVFPVFATGQPESFSPANINSGNINPGKNTKNNQRLLAILYVTTSISGLEAALGKRYSGLVKTQLTQNIGIQQFMNFLSTGNGGDFSSRIVDVPDSHWQLEVRPSAALATSAAHVPAWVVWLLAVTAVAGCAGAGYLAVRKPE